jgi:hypothetical protein
MKMVDETSHSKRAEGGVRDPRHWVYGAKEREVDMLGRPVAPYDEHRTRHPHFVKLV